jgi:hypothetical protein
MLSVTFCRRLVWVVPVPAMPQVPPTRLAPCQLMKATETKWAL